MIKIGKLTDYAIVMLGQLSKEGIGVSRSASFLAEKTGISEPTVAKVLKILSKANLVASARGVSGGYQLTKNMRDISIADVIAAIEGPIAIVSCVDGSDESCKVEAKCPVKGNWDRVNTAIKSALQDIKLSDMTVVTCQPQQSIVKMRLTTSQAEAQ